MLPENIHKTIRGKREELGYTQAELAERAGISTTFMSEVESGKRNISLGVFYQLAKALDIPMEQFFAKKSPEQISKHQMVKLLRVALPSLDETVVRGIFTLVKPHLAKNNARKKRK